MMERSGIRNKKAVLFSIALLVAGMMMLAVTQAWFTAMDSEVNQLKTRIAAVSILEVFTPPNSWNPGQEVTKQVCAVNNGDVDMLVRISFEEVLGLLGNGGAMKPSTNRTPANGDIPVHMNVSGYTPENGWNTITELGLTCSTVPPEVTVYGKSVTLGSQTTYSFVLFYATNFIYANLDGSSESKAINQKVTADFSVSGSTLTISNINYYYFSKKVAVQKDWAGLQAMDGVTKMHIENNVRVGKAPYDVTAGAGPITVSSPSCAEVTRLLSDSKISLVYGVDFDTSASVEGVATGMWWYNQDDGYFYYLGTVAAGAHTPNLLEKIVLNETAGEAYNLMELDIVVCLEAIQNTTDAICSEAGWGLNQSGPIYTKMSTYCVY